MNTSFYFIARKCDCYFSRVVRLYHPSFCKKPQLCNENKFLWPLRCLKVKSTIPRFTNSFRQRAADCLQQGFHTTSRRPINPLLVLVFKFKGLKVLKAVSIVFGRASRKLHDKLPLSVQHQFSRHKIIVTCCVFVMATIAYYSYAHHDVCPLTGRKRWISFTRDQILVLSKMDHEHLLKMYDKKFVSKDEPVYQTCSALVKALVTSNQDIGIVKDIDWNLNIVYDDDMQNAFVLPNGEIYIFTGMIHLMSSWEELAIIIGHEMAHAILGHVQEQQSFAVFGDLLVIPLLTFIWFLFDDFAAFVAYSIQQYIFPLIFEVGFNLPYSRQLESEADIVGLDLAAKACFDPRWGVLLWDKLALKEAVDDFIKEDGGKIEFMSSHPSHDRRAAILEARLSEVLTIREKCHCPKLPFTVDPVLNAHRLRKFVVNIRERTVILKEINEIMSKADSNNNLSSDEMATLKKLKERLSHLTFEYQTMMKEEGIDLSSPAKSSQNEPPPQKVKSDPGQSGSRWSKASLWSRIVGGFISYKSLLPSHISNNASMSAKEETLITRSLEPNAFGKRQAKRDYYNSFEEE